MKKVILAAAISALLSSNAQADTVAGIYIGGQVWNNEASGIFGESANQVDFNLSDEQQGSFYIALEHPIPFIPNAKIASTSLETTGSTVLQNNIEFGDEPFSINADVDAGFDVSYVDYTLYYEIFDNGLFSFDIGLTGRDFSGDVTVSATVNTAPAGDTPVNTTSTGQVSTDDIIPMIYASTVVGLPFTGLNVFAEGNFLSIDDHTLYDYQAGLSYDLVDNVMVDVNVTLGYRAVKLELEDLSDLYTDLEFKGVFAGMILHF
ncbi:TIGR04219 family outer membrane beta-barrel protein [Colwelliaceae bacterium 6441]